MLNLNADSIFKQLSAEIADGEIEAAKWQRKVETLKRMLADLKPSLSA